MDHYRMGITDAVENLSTVSASVFNSMIDIIMQGELKSWSENVPVGEIHSFDLDLFKNSHDTNLQLLADLVEQIESVRESIMNLNGLQMDNENWR